uniref:G-protein coupled receptors family 1 profile domain-containing protein n=1 Tax=Plectus sambesii TaxID=2011161 RepID=A0A914WAX6_9BILA
MYDLLLTITKMSTLLHILTSVPLYLACLTIVLRNRNTAPFNSPFFLIYLAHGFIDLVNFFDYVIEYDLPFWGYFPSLYEPFGQPNWFGKIIDFVVWSTGFIQYWIIVLVAANRYTAVCWPLRYRKIWSQRNVYFAIAICFIMPTLMCVPVWWNNVMYIEYIGFENKTMIYGPFIEVAAYDSQ